ncbi:MAG: dihydrolipoamide acetyltransferase [Deltaproteobacteria bacterium]|jgi:hypothetical protein|nr:dihydrolipoamide acetyltransferase [Deltaproteobacteria bacterium]MBT6491700.1 dihydrolipoamide acetyltransferase [Deltaproteobacteria bacterium]
MKMHSIRFGILAILVTVLSLAAPVSAQTTGVSGDKPAYNLKLRDIEERVNDLKEKIFQSKARLIQLQEVVLHGTISGAKAKVVHRNEMGASFSLARAQYSLDGTPIFNRRDSGEGELADADEIEIFNGTVAPGNHQISVYLEYRGNGFGIFSYLNDYKFKIKSSYTFTAEEGRITSVRVVGFEKGGITTELTERPTVRYDIETTRAFRKEDATNEDESANQ